jgi:hypothetical protein
MNDLDEKEDKFYTAQEVVENFFKGRIKYQGVLRMTRMGKIPAKKIGKSYLYSKVVLEEWVKNNFSTPQWSKIKKY